MKCRHISVSRGKCALESGHAGPHAFEHPERRPTPGMIALAEDAESHGVDMGVKDLPKE